MPAGRPKQFREQIAVLVEEGTAERIERVRGETKKADLLREAIDREVKRRERARK